MLVSSPGVGYTFDGSTLTTNISTWTFDTKFKVLVKTNDAELKGKANNLVLQVKVGETGYANPKGAIVVNRDYIMFLLSNGSSNYIGMQGAVAESDGLAFYYVYCDATASDTIIFSLIDTTDGTTKTYSVSGKTLDSNSYTFKAISIDYSKFKEVE